MKIVWLFAAAALLAGCAASPPPASTANAAPATLPNTHVPPFARWPYAPFSREAAVAIALREWRAFGQPVAVPNAPPQRDAEREEGLWQRIGEYWWLGMDEGERAQGFTGIHDDNGRIFSGREDRNYAWSAAFISYVMRMAGAGSRFPYSAVHADYLSRAALADPGTALALERVGAYAPQRGDLICYARTRRPLQIEDLATAGRFPGHCDIIVDKAPGQLLVIGGNVQNAVSMKRIPVDAQGLLAGPDGTLYDPDHAWFAILRVGYDR